MQWFKHDTASTQDAKVRKLVLRHGAIGYAVYFHCIELIAGDTSEANVTFELEHDAEIIADNLKIKGTANQSAIEVVQDVMIYAIDLGLFSNIDGRIFCFKLLKRLDTSMTSSPKFRTMISKAKEERHDAVMIESGQCHDVVMQEEIRVEEIRKEKKKPLPRFAPPTLQEVKDYCHERKNFVDPEKFIDFYESKGWMVGRNKMKSWKASVRTWEKDSTSKPDTPKKGRLRK